MRRLGPTRTTLRRGASALPPRFRKTYYENEQNGYAGGWSSFLNSLYKYVIIALIIIIIMKKRYRETKLWGIVVALIMYPTIVYYLIEFVKYGYYSIASKTNWVYLQL